MSGLSLDVCFSVIYTVIFYHAYTQPFVLDRENWIELFEQSAGSHPCFHLSSTNNTVIAFILSACTLLLLHFEIIMRQLLLTSDSPNVIAAIWSKRRSPDSKNFTLSRWFVRLMFVHRRINASWIFLSLCWHRVALYLASWVTRPQWVLIHHSFFIRF